MSDDGEMRGLQSIRGLVGQIPTRGVYMAQFFGTSTLNTFIFGSMGGFLGSTMLGTGPLLPFLVGSWAGFSVSCVYIWNRDTKRAVTVAERYPLLVQHLLSTEFPDEFETTCKVPTKEEILQNLKLRTKVILCTYALQPAVDEIVKRRTEALKEHYASQDSE